MARAGTNTCLQFMRSRPAILERVVELRTVVRAGLILLSLPWATKCLIATSSP